MFSNLLDKLRYLKDKAYVNKIYRSKYGRNIDWVNPKRFTEKINIFKISRDAVKVAKYTDKYLVRDYVKDSIGQKYLVPILGVYSDPQDIDIEKLPDQFVLKCNHGSGMNIICTDKSKMNWQQVKAQLSIWMKKNYYHTFGRELQYKYLKPKIICEKYLTNDDNDIIDYKIYCFRGKPEFIRVMTGRLSILRKNLYDLNWRKPQFEFLSENNDPHFILPKPKNLQEMLSLAEKLSKPFPFVRVDFYLIKGQIYFGELTFTPAAGIQFFNPDSYDELYGSKF